MSESADAFIRNEGTKWTLGSATMTRTIVFRDGRLLLESLLDRSSGRELAVAGSPSAEFAFTLGTPEPRLTSADGGWALLGADESRGTQGELQLAIRVAREGLEVTKTYVVYPGSSLLREWVTFRNSGARPVEVLNPAFLSVRAATGGADTLDFLWMTGGDNQPGSWDLKTEKLSSEKPRRFDSYEPFPLDLGKVTYPGDGINA